MNTIWTKQSWRNFPIKQQPQYPSIELLQNELDKIKQLPPLISKLDVINFKKDLKEVSSGKKIILHMGDCAERFQDCTEHIINQKQQFMNICAELIEKITQKKVEKVGRIAGQYAKPRSQEFDSKNNVFNYKGDNVNSLDLSQRTPDPTKLYLGFLHAISTINILRGNFINEVHQFDNENVREFKDQMYKQIKNYDKQCEFQQNVLEILKNHQQEINNSDNISNSTIQQQQEESIMKISHEGLILDLEEALTFEHENKEFFNQSADLVWIGLRTNEIEGAHIEYIRGIQNPVGVKVGPTTTPEHMVEICKKINPENRDDKLIIIPRLGKNKSREYLPKFIEAKKEHNLNFIWMCDAMHGNTITEGAYKVRKVEDVVGEIRDFCEILKENNEIIGGVSLEATYSDVTECLGGSINCIGVDNLGDKYTTACDPRLNGVQTLEVLNSFAKYYKQ